MSTYECLSLILAMIGCTWTLCGKLNRMVSREECARLRSSCRRRGKKRPGA